MTSSIFRVTAEQLAKFADLDTDPQFVLLAIAATLPGVERELNFIRAISE